MTSLPENQQKSIFFDLDGNPKRQPSFCVYVDILGFKDVLKNADSAFHHFMKNVRPAFRNFAMPSKDAYYYQEHWQAKVFSDNVFLVYPFERGIRESGDGEAEFGRVISKIAWFQLECFYNDYVLRGGVTFGDKFIDEETIFGEPLAELVEIENTTKYPRITLSPSLFSFLNTYSSFYGKNTRSPVLDDFIIDSDGTVFINYLDHVTQSTEYSIEFYAERLESINGYDFEALERHKELVQAKLKEYVSKPSVFLKYLWLASYHNYCCNYYKSYLGFSESLFIDGNFPDYGFRPLMLEDIKETR